MNQKQYHSLEELPLMMNMTDVAEDAYYGEAVRWR